MLTPSLWCITNGLWHHCTQQITSKKAIPCTTPLRKGTCIHGRSWQHTSQPIQSLEWICPWPWWYLSSGNPFTSPKNWKICESGRLDWFYGYQGDVRMNKARQMNPCGDSTAIDEKIELLVDKNWPEGAVCWWAQTWECCLILYHQNVFLPGMRHFCNYTRTWDQECESDQSLPQPHEWHVVIWYHNEFTFYTNNRCKSEWVHSSETAIAYVKGEGPSQMVADVVSADYGWLHSPDGKHKAWVFFKVGKNWEGYFTNDEILEQATRIMDILDEHYAGKDHVLVFDNVTTHTKQANRELSACSMLKSTWEWGVEVNLQGPDGKLLKHKIKMEDTTFADGSPQSLYFQSGLQEGLFKGMTVLLQEWGLHEEVKLNVQCQKFKCQMGNKNCCQRWVLYNQLDFVQAKSLLEELCEAHSYVVLFLPKFRYELNFIKQCWGFAKQVYQKYPASSIWRTMYFLHLSWSHWRACASG